MASFEEIMLRRGWQVGTLGSVVAYGARPILDRLIGPRLTRDEVERRRAMMPVVEAQLGAEAVNAALQKNDTELRRIGEAMVASALLGVDNAANPAEIPPEVTEGVTGIAASVPLDDIEANPYISASDAGRIVEIIEGANDAGPFA